MNNSYFCDGMDQERKNFIMRILQSEVSNKSEWLRELWSDQPCIGRIKSHNSLKCSDEDWKLIFNIEDLLPLSLMSGQCSDLLGVLLVAYAVKKRISIDTNNVICDELYHRLYDAVKATSLRESIFDDCLTSLYQFLQKIDYNSYLRLYPIIVDRIFRMNHLLLKSPRTYPQQFISRTITDILSSYAVETVYNPYAGVCSLPITLPDNISCHATESSGIYSLMALVLLDAYGKTNVTVHNSKSWPKKSFDALLTILPIDYRKDLDKRYQIDEERAEIQANFFSSLLKNKNIKKVAIVIVHIDFLYASYFYKTRKKICENGVLCKVVLLPKGTFCDVDNRCAILVLNLECACSSIEFIDASRVIKDNIPLYWSLQENDFNILQNISSEEKISIDKNDCVTYDYSLFPAHYLQKNHSVKEGEILSTLSNFCTLAHKTTPEEYAPLLYRSFLSSSMTGIKSRLQWHASEKYRSCYSFFEGKHIVLSLENGIVKCALTDNNDKFFIEPDVYALIVDETKIRPDYLAYILANDNEFAAYLYGVSEQYSQKNGTYLMNAVIPVIPTIERQDAFIEEVIRMEETDAVSKDVYNLIMASKAFVSDKGEKVRELSKLNLKVLDSTSTLSGGGGVRELLRQYIDNPTSILYTAEAIIIDEDIEDREYGFYPVLRDWRELVSKGKNVILCILSNHNKESLSRELYNTYGDPVTILDEVIVSPKECFSDALRQVRQKLEASSTSDAALRNKYVSEFKNADAIDDKYDWKVSVTILKFLRQPNINSLRTIVHNIVKFLQDKNVVPNTLQPGGVLDLLCDTTYTPTKKDNPAFFQIKEVFPESLSLSLRYFKDIANPASHENGPLGKHIPMAILEIVFELLDWFKTVQIDKGRFDKQVTGYYRTSDEKEIYSISIPYDGSVQKIRLKGIDYFFCGNVHIQYKQGLQEGQRIRINKINDEKQARVVQGSPIVFFAPKDYYDILE